MQYFAVVNENELLPIPEFVIIAGTADVQPMHLLGGTVYLRGRKDSDRFRGIIPMHSNLNLSDFRVVDENAIIRSCFASQCQFGAGSAHVRE